MTSSDQLKPTKRGQGPWRSGDAAAEFQPFPDEAVAGSVTDRFMQMVRQYPDRQAISSPGGSWSYSELGDEVVRVAGGLHTLHGDERAPVAILAAHDGPLVVAILGVIAAGLIVVVLDPAAPVAQTRHLLDECSARFLLHDSAHAEAAAALLAVPPTATIPQPQPQPLPLAALRATSHPLPVRTAEAPVMLAFTSGTSGSSKAAIITHGTLLNLVRGATNALGVSQHDRMPMLFPTSLAVAAYPMFLPLLNGGTLATLDVRSVGLAPMAEFLRRERITIAYMAPTVVRFLVDALVGHSFPDLRLLALGGELVDREVLKLTDDLFSPTWLANGYGTTETGVVTLWVADADDLRTNPLAVDVLPAGYAMADVEISILDDHGSPVPAGDAGEITVVSPYMFAGYWGHPELNRQVLSDDPKRRSGWRSYRTGDLGRTDDDGALVPLGRLDTQVKIRGRAVVLGDVEAAIGRLEGVVDTAVVANTRDGVVELVAYVVPSADARFDGTALRAAMLASDEAYRVPERWIFLPEFPRLPNGKFDRRALPPVDTPAELPAGGPPLGPELELEVVRQRLRAIWSRLLPGASVGLDDDFVHLGGHSLLAAEMLLVVEREFDVIVPMGELVQARTVRALADTIVRLRSRRADIAVSTVASVNPGDGSARPRLWFVHDLHGSAYRVRHLADALGTDQPVWSFESPLLRGEPNPYRTLAAFAANYLADLQAVQPKGPYWLGGYSFGGVVAYEMARQLRKDGQDVAFVGVVDVGPGYRGFGWSAHRSPLRPWFGVAMPPAPGMSLLDQARHYALMARQGPRRLARHLMVRTGVARLVDPFRFRADLRRTGRVRPEWRLWYAWEEHWRLAAKCWDRSSTYPGRIHLFWASESGSADASMGWAALVENLEIHRFAGHHAGTLEAGGAGPLAAALRAAMDGELARRVGAGEAT